MRATLISSAVYGECRADDFLAVDDSLGAVDAAFLGYNPSDDTALITASRLAGAAYSVTLTSDQGALRVPKSYLFHWFSKMQRSVTLSSAEAEFFGTMLAEVIFIRERLIDLGFIVDAASVIKCDSKSAVGMAFDPVAFKKTKHILRAAEFLRDLVTREVVSVEHISGAVMLADILTKAASRGVFVDLIKQLDSFA